MFQSEELHTVMYKCIWYEQNLKFKRDLYFAMMRMSRPLVLRAGLYMRLSRQTFVAVRLIISFLEVILIVLHPVYSRAYLRI